MCGWQADSRCSFHGVSGYSPAQVIPEMAYLNVRCSGDCPRWRPLRLTVRSTRSAERFWTNFRIVDYKTIARLIYLGGLSDAWPTDIDDEAVGVAAAEREPPWPSELLRH